MESNRKPGGLEKFQVTDHEECGLIIRNNDGMLYVVKVPNRSKTPKTDYAIHSDDVQKVKEVLSPDESVIGFLHTHVEGDSVEPSDNDFDGADFQPNMEHLIYHPASKTFCWYGSTEVMR